MFINTNTVLHSTCLECLWIPTQYSIQPVYNVYEYQYSSPFNLSRMFMNTNTVLHSTCTMFMNTNTVLISTQCCGSRSGSKGSASFCRIRIHDIFHGSGSGFGSRSRSEPSSLPPPSPPPLHLIFHPSSPTPTPSSIIPHPSPSPHLPHPSSFN